MKVKLDLGEFNRKMLDLKLAVNGLDLLVQFLDEKEHLKVDDLWSLAVLVDIVIRDFQVFREDLGNALEKLED